MLSRPATVKSIVRIQCKINKKESSHLIGAECLAQVRVLEEARDGQHIGARVHHDEEEDAAEVEA